MTQVTDGRTGDVGSWWLGCDDRNREGWTRSFGFLFWTWTVRSYDHDKFLEIRQRRILGYEEISYYSRTLWLLMNGILFSVFGASLAVGWTVTLMAGPEFSDFLFILFGPMTLVFAILAIAFYYLTFVPPKEYRMRSQG